MKIFSMLLFVFTAYAPLNYAYASAKSSSAIETVNKLFDAMRTHDKHGFLQQFTEDALMQRITKDGAIKNSELYSFADFIEQTSRHLDEQLFQVSVQESDNLASVWAPFAFYLDGKLSHCGVNSLQLIKVNQQWKIQYLIDNEHQGDCSVFKNNLVN